MTDLSPGEEQMRREHDGLAAAVASTQRHAAQIQAQLSGLRQFHPHHDLDYHDAIQTHYRLVAELRDLARIARVWGGRP